MLIKVASGHAGTWRARCTGSTTRSAPSRVYSRQHRRSTACSSTATSSSRSPGTPEPRALWHFVPGSRLDGAAQLVRMALELVQCVAGGGPALSKQLLWRLEARMLSDGCWRAMCHDRHLAQEQEKHVMGPEYTVGQLRTAMPLGCRAALRKLEPLDSSCHHSAHAHVHHVALPVLCMFASCMPWHLPSA